MNHAADAQKATARRQRLQRKHMQKLAGLEPTTKNQRLQQSPCTALHRTQRWMRQRYEAGDARLKQASTATA